MGFTGFSNYGLPNFEKCLCYIVVRDNQIAILMPGYFASSDHNTATCKIVQALEILL